MNLRSLDLNLLVVFDALMRKRGVTVAAEEIGLTQPAMSNALRRIRDMLDDDVLVREGQRMRPTPRALELESPVRQALRNIEEALAPRPAFDPTTSEQTFWIGSRSYMQAVLVAQLASHIGNVAPRVDLRIRDISQLLPVEDLDRGRYDLAIGYFPGLHETMQHETLFDDDFVVLARRGHPGISGSTLSVEDYVGLDHLLLAPMGGEVGPVDVRLAEQGLSRRVALTLPSFQTAPFVVASTDLVCTMPSRAAAAAISALGLQVLAPPVFVQELKASMSWHSRTDKDSAHEWFREQVRIVARGNTA